MVLITRDTVDQYPEKVCMALYTNVCLPCWYFTWYMIMVTTWGSWISFFKISSFYRSELYHNRFDTIMSYTISYILPRRPAAGCCAAPWPDCAASAGRFSIEDSEDTTWPQPARIAWTSALLFNPRDDGPIMDYGLYERMQNESCKLQCRGFPHRIQCHALCAGELLEWAAIKINQLAQCQWLRA